MSKAKRSRALAAPYKPGPADKAALAAYRTRQAKRPSARVKVAKGTAGSSVGPDHPDLAYGTLGLLNALGTASTAFSDGLLKQVTNAASQGSEPSESDINFVLSVVNGIGPKDEVEAMLGAQMAAVHMATMTFARRLAHVENIPQQDAAERAFNKLARTFTAQVEALKRYRSDGRQTVRVERVTVEAGGQAIVGALQTGSGPGGGASDQIEEQPYIKALAHAPADAPVTPLRSQSEDEGREPMPVAGDVERKMPLARRRLPGRA